jgi:hypothetical protein
VCDLPEKYETLKEEYKGKKALDEGRREADFFSCK